jgi:hypothetical protein
MKQLRLEYPVIVLCRVFDVSRSGFYAWTQGKLVAARAGLLTVHLSARGEWGMPCFTVFQKGERRFGAPEFRSISVTDVAAGGKSMMWTMSIPPERPFQVTFRLCIPYAGRLPVLPKTTALPLQPGKLYEALIDIKPPMSASALGIRRPVLSATVRSAHNFVDDFKKFIVLRRFSFVHDCA